MRTVLPTSLLTKMSNLTKWAVDICERDFGKEDGFVFAVHILLDTDTYSLIRLGLAITMGAETFSAWHVETRTVVEGWFKPGHDDWIIPDYWWDFDLIFQHLIAEVSTLESKTLYEGKAS